MKESLFILIVFALSTCSVYAQTKTIKGRVIDEFMETTPGVQISIDDTIKVGQTDMNGYF